MTLAAVIITFNEERNIHDCIASVHDFCDEIIVLDSGSTDRTREIAGSFPKVKFSVHPFDGHIEQKNRAMALAVSDWLFCLDADERVSPDLSRSIQEFCRSEKGSMARVRRLTYHLGRPIRHGGWYNARIRLLRRGSGLWGGENPHDEIIPQGKGRPLLLEGDLVHYSFLDLSDQIQTINKFSSIVAFTRKGKGRSFRLGKLLLKPPAKFLEMYLFKAGFLDGMPGFIIAVASAFSTFLKWAKLYELSRGNLERPSNLRPDYRAASPPE
ncbi:MAG: glycosyltransferase family 2 protein [Spirochaetales bacterium]|nr:glycosyltransferase family 2 protein [Spirochaetales bacterium]